MLSQLSNVQKSDWANPDFSWRKGFDVLLTPARTKLMFVSRFRCQPMTLQCIQHKIIEETHKLQGCKHKEGGAAATSGCETGHARVPAAAKAYGKWMGHQIGDSERKRIVGVMT